MVLTHLSSICCLARGETLSSSVGVGPDCRQNRQNRIIRFAKSDSSVFVASSRSFWFLFGNRSSPAMTLYEMEIYNNNIIMSSINTNPEVRERPKKMTRGGGDEWETIKISRGNLAYAPKLIRCTSFLARSGQHNY
jgi:hypothetical protein